MTKITFYVADGIYIGFRADGHAGYAPQGEDIVCAGISVLTINFINSVDTFTKDKFNVNAEEDGGLIEFKFDDKPSDKSRLLIDSLVLGLKELENENKDFISLEYKEV